MESKYPNPCLRCDKEYCRNGGSNYQECALWLTWFRWWWKRFNSILNEPQKKKFDNDHKFCYVHPDEVKRYLQRSPCKSCSADKNCDIPCRVYLQWYNARMEAARKNAAERK